MAQRRFEIAVQHPLASAASSTPPRIPLGDETPRNDKELPLGDKTLGTKEDLHPLTRRASLTPPQLPLGDETLRNNLLARKTSSTPPQLPLGDKTPGKKRPRGNQLQGQTQRPTSKGVVGKTIRIMETARIMDTEDHGNIKDHGHNKDDAPPPRVRRKDQASRNPEHKTTTTKKSTPNLQR